MVLQEQSDEALPPQTVGGVALGSNFPSVRAYVDLIEDWVHKGKVTIGLGTGQTEVTSYTERNMFNAQFGNQANCVAAGGTTAICNSNTTRSLGTNANASLATKIYLQQTWARPDLINSPGTKTLDPKTASATYDPTKPVPSYYSSLETMTAALVTGMNDVANFADDDGTSGITSVIPTGQAFLAAVQLGFATRNMYASNALTDNLIDLWFNDGTHPSVAGSYLNALTTFGSVTGLDPAMFGADEVAAKDLGLSGYEAYILQEVASYQLGFRNTVPEPGTLVLVAAALGLMGATARRRKQK